MLTGNALTEIGCLIIARNDAKPQSTPTRHQGVSSALSGYDSVRGLR